VPAPSVLLVPGLPTLVWPPRPRRTRRSRAEPTPARPIQAAPARPAQSILPRRLIDSPSASRPAGGFVFPPPADYVPPPLPREEVRPLTRPIGLVRPATAEEAKIPPPVEHEASPPVEPVEAPVAPPEPEHVVPAYIPPPAVEIEPPPTEPAAAPVEAEPSAFEPD